MLINFFLFMLIYNLNKLKIKELKLKKTKEVKF